MRKCFSIPTIALLLLVLSLPAPAQFAPPAGGLGGPPAGPRFGGAMSQLFGENNAFTARLDMEIKDPGAPQAITMPGKISFLEGKTRFEMDVSEAKGTQMPAQVAAQMKALGLGAITMISRPDKKLAYLVYPGMQSYVETPLAEDEAAAPDAKYKVESTEIGKETVDGRPCVKNRVIVTDEKGNQHHATVWNATELKNFPLRMEYTEDGRNATMTFRELKFAKPNANLFDPPATFTRYESLAGLMRGIMLKQFGGAGSDKD